MRNAKRGHLSTIIERISNLLVNKHFFRENEKKCCEGWCWKMLGHVLRMDSNTPARMAMKFFFENRNEVNYRGRKRASIHSTINRDIRNTLNQNPQFGIKELITNVDLHNIGVKARNRNHWKNVVKQVVQSAYSNTSQNQNWEVTVLKVMCWRTSN